MNLFESSDDLLRLAPVIAVKFAVAVLCGGAIGMEREVTGKPAGLRTNILVCLGSMLYTVISLEMGRETGGDPTRIAAQIVTGIGFLGAGAILHQRGNMVKGLTTAAMIWFLAALGMMIGYGYLISACAVTFASVCMILALRAVENRIRHRFVRDYLFIIPDTREARERITGLVHAFDDYVERFTIERKRGEDGEAILRLKFNGPVGDRRDLLQGLYAIEGVRMEEGWGRGR